MQDYLKKLVDEVSTWPHVSVHPHRFGGREFLFDKAEVGHVHTGGVVDIPFTRSVHDALLNDGLVEQHRWVPNSGWITFHARNEEDLSHALWLMRLSYLRFAVKAASDPSGMLERECDALQLTPQLRSLMEKFVPATANHAAMDTLSV